MTTLRGTLAVTLVDVSWSRFSLAGAAGAQLTPDAVRYGPGLPHEDALKLLGPLEGRRILDLGCGAGSNAVALALAGAKVIAVDTSPDNLYEAREAAKRAGVKIEVHQVPLAELAFVRADTVDAALSVYGLAPVTDLDRVFRQVHRVLRTEHDFVFSLPHPAFNLMDPQLTDPRLSRQWWDPRPLEWSRSTPDGDADVPRTMSALFTSLGRANFAVDTVLEPQADQTTAGQSWTPHLDFVPPTLIIRARKQGL